MKGNLFPVTNAHTYSHTDSQSIQAPYSLAAYGTDTQLKLDKVLMFATTEVVILSLRCLLVSIHPQAEWMLVLHSSSRKAGGGNNSCYSCLWGGIISDLCINCTTSERQDRSKVLAEFMAMSVAAAYSADGSCYFVFCFFYYQ